ncbi:MAG: HAD family hydrolase [Spirochaetales bacterium]|nr:HAD family hydrolase [Spirochaetales bacterium]MBQ2258773.1 HAD family hydrolase [Spirochaetales bacterium]
MGYASEHNIKAICFDIDGTFYPKWKMDWRLLKASIFHLPFALKYNSMRKRVRREDGYGELEPMSYDEISKRSALYVFGDDSPESAARYRRMEKKIFHDQWERSYLNLKSAPGVKKTLEKAKKEGFRMAALSDFPIGVKLKAMGIEDKFELILSSEDIGHFKPAMTPFRALQNGLGLKPEEILYVGDSYTKDILGANSAGMHSCLIFAKKKSEYEKADIIAADWEEFFSKVF